MFSSMLSLLGSLRGGSSFVTNSLRFRSSASAYLSRTPSVAGNRQTWTWSGWVKRGAFNSNSFFWAGSNATSATYAKLFFNDISNGILQINCNDGATQRILAASTAVFRDPSAWYHIVFSVDTTQAVNINGVRLFVNGVPQTLSFTVYTQNIDTAFNSTQRHEISSDFGNSSFFDGYLAEVHFIDGQALTPASFGAINSSTGVWAPSRYTGTYGTNGFYLKFADASAATAAAIGKDSSGNGNNWTPNNISVTAGVTYDSMIDVPVNYSDGGNGRGNYATWNPVIPFNASSSISNGNLQATLGGAVNANANGLLSTLRVNSGKWYVEFVLTTITNSNSYPFIGITDSASLAVGNVSSNNASYAIRATGTIDALASKNTAYGASFANGDICMLAVDFDGGKLWYGKNGTWFAGGNPAAGTNPSSSGISTSTLWAFATSGDGNAVTVANFGQRPFTYTPPAGFRALNTNNLPTPSIVNGANFMAATTYTGNAAARSLSNTVNSVSFQPDLVWIKSRTPGATNHALFDSVRGTGNYLSSNTTAAETPLAQSLTAFNADGFSLGTDTTLVNANANSYIAWQWKESITAGLDIVSYTGTGVDRTVAHNLGVAPAMIIVKRSQTGATSNWQVRHTSIPVANSIQLNLQNAAAAATTVWASTAPTSSEFTVGTSADVNASGVSYVAYCFAEIAGYSKFGSYTGNGSADGPFCFTGFRPRWILFKSATGATSDHNWGIYDTTREESNACDLIINGNLSAAEISASINPIDLTSNGFKIRGTGVASNTSGATYIFAAFAETPSKYALAR